MTDYANEIVDRCAPRWAWELIDETLAMDAQSHAFDKDLRERIGKALAAMQLATETPELAELSEDDVEE